ncbi:MAG: cysteine dioxygenase [Cyanobacteria bacterium P01_A01_bin.37]
MPIHQFPRSIQTLIRSLTQFQNFSPKSVKSHIEQANISSKDVMPWSDFSHPVTDSYGRKLVFHGGYFEIMVMSWVPGDYSAIHDHGCTQWGAVQCFGVADHYLYDYRQGLLKTSHPAHYQPGMIHDVDNGLIHQMGNPGDASFLSLHVYGCVTHREMITGNARIFDLLEGTIQYGDGGAFFCAPEDGIKRRRSGVRGDTETTLRHHQLMGDRIRRILATHDSPTLTLKLEQITQEIARLNASLSPTEMPLTSHECNRETVISRCLGKSQTLNS